MFRAPANPDLPPIVFIHGASANLKDQMMPLRPLLEGRAELLFLDRPGHGWSGRGPGNNENPTAQAATIAALMDELGIGPAIIVGHSFGGAVAAAFGARPGRKRQAGCCSCRPPPILGRAGRRPGITGLRRCRSSAGCSPKPSPIRRAPARLAAATTCVFAPNKAPDLYAEQASIPLVLQARGVSLQCHRCRRPLSSRPGRRTALSRDQKRRPW